MWSYDYYHTTLSQITRTMLSNMQESSTRLDTQLKSRCRSPEADNAELFHQADERDWRGRSEGAVAQDGWQSKQPASSGAASQQPTSHKDASKGDEKANVQQKGPAAATSSQASAPANAQVLTFDNAGDLSLYNTPPCWNLLPKGFTCLEKTQE